MPRWVCLIQSVHYPWIIPLNIDSEVEFSILSNRKRRNVSRSSENLMRDVAVVCHHVTINFTPKLCFLRQFKPATLNITTQKQSGYVLEWTSGFCNTPTLLRHSTSPRPAFNLHIPQSCLLRFPPTTAG